MRSCQSGSRAHRETRICSPEDLRSALIVADSWPDGHQLVSRAVASSASMNIHSSGTAAASRPGPSGPKKPRARSSQLVTQPPPSDWTPVVDEQTKLTYYWNQNTGETTALGEPLPGPEGRRVATPVTSSAPSLLGLVGTGAGFGLVFGIMGYLIG
ncbi:hypothetical protein WJX84_000119 [Apatococcus fuscideae]|uniref:WW domain-containing protein n=1 Tax=Apatococcus fuscideae TaxID=2026836 RepID=A0AAW1SQ00_9CHLO